MTQFSNTDDMIDIRDVIARFEELETELQGYHEEQETTLSFEYALQDAENFPEHSDEFEEFKQLQALLEECKGNGGDEEWRGDWYPVTLIHEDYFERAMDEMIEDCYDLPKDLPFWMTVTYDYAALKMDYTSVDYDGQTYFVR